MRLELLIPPVAGAIIGWVTNYVAIKLLFRPHIPFSILGYQVQGVIPKRRKEIARSMARAIEKDLLSSGDFAKALSGLDWEKEIENTVEEAVERPRSLDVGKERLVVRTAARREDSDHPQHERTKLFLSQILH